MDTQTLDLIRRKLIHRGQSLLGSAPSPTAGEMTGPLSHQRQSVGDTAAAEQTVAERRAHVREAEAAALIRIQASLARIAQGTFGDCVICHAPIETERLRAIPEIDRCGGCTH